MAGDHNRYEFQLRQRLTSTGLNTQDALTARAIYEVMRRQVSADRGAVTGVVDGLLVTVQPGTLNIQIGGGLATVYDAGAGLPDSKQRWIEVFDDSPITKTLDPGDLLARWDLVEIEPGTASGPGEILDFYDGNTGQFIPAVAAPNKVCAPVVTITKGTPSASPQFPGGTAGRIPLGYIYVPAGAIALVATDVLYCRPLIRPRTHELPLQPLGDLPTLEIRGGGYASDAFSLTGSLAREMSGYFKNSTHKFYIPQNAALQLSVKNYDGGGLPGASQCVYFYAVPPSAVYPTGYSAEMVERELYIHNNNRITPGGYAFNQRNCFVIASGTPPNNTNQGEPLLGPLAINHPNFGVVLIDRELCVYVGSAFFDVALVQLVPQRIHGAMVGSGRKTGADFGPDLPIVAPTAYSVASNLAADPDYALPAHVQRVRVTFNANIGVNTWIYVQFADRLATFGGAKPVIIYDKLLDPNALESYTGCEFWASINALQQVVVLLADASLAGTCGLYVWEWEDPILERRGA